MTDQQLYLAIGIPSALFALNLLILLGGFFWQAKRFEDMSKRFDDQGKRFDDLKDVFKQSLLRVEQVMDVRVAALERERRP